MAKVISLKTRTQGTRRSAAEWRELISMFKRGGGTRKQFCARHGIALSTFAWWQSRLGSQLSATAPEQPVFVELMPERADAPAPILAGALDLELELGDGLVIRLRRTPC